MKELCEAMEEVDSEETRITALLGKLEIMMKKMENTDQDENMDQD